MLPGEIRPQVKRLLRSYATDRYITAAKEERNNSPASGDPGLLGSAVCRRCTSDPEQETLWPRRGSIFVLEGTERVFQTCLFSGPCLLMVKSSL